MKFEKLNDDKIRITLSSQDLIDKDIDFHSFMSNSLKSQDIFLDILEEAEKEVGFVTKDYKVRIEALAMNDGNFIFTVTRLTPNKEKDLPKNAKVRFRRKKIDIETEHLVYRFNTFDDFCSFTSFLQTTNIKSINSISKTIILYKYKDFYYLVFSYLNPEYKYNKKLFSLLAEFSTYISNPELFSRKLCECGEIFIKNNAIKTVQKYFV